MDLRRIRRAVADISRLVSTDLQKRRRLRTALRSGSFDWEAMPERVRAEARPVFFLSTGRAGTTFLTRLLEMEPALDVNHRPEPQMEYSSRLAYEKLPGDLEAVKFAIYAARYEPVLHAFLTGRRWVETNCRITFFAPALAELFPRSKFVQVVRHPADFVRNALAMEYYDNTDYYEPGLLRPVAGEAREQWPHMSRHAKCAWLWNETYRFSRAFGDALEAERFLIVRSEDLFVDFGEVERVFRFMAQDMTNRHAVQKLFGSSRARGTSTRQASDSDYSDWPQEAKADVRRWATEAGRYGYEL